jgi:hypothetical protein
MDTALVGAPMKKTLCFVIALFGALACDESPVAPADAGLVTADASVDAGVSIADAGASDAATAAPDADAGGCGQGDACPEGQACSVYGQCFDGECLVHGDCLDTERCHQGQCLNRPTPEFGILFERVHGLAFADHLSTIPSGNERRSASAYGDFGFGVTPFDMDGDQDLDLFIGTQGRGGNVDTPSCIYRNDSTPSNPHFVRDDLFCGFKRPGISGGFGTDLEGDGYHELIMTGMHTIRVQRFHPRLEQIDLHALVPTEDDRDSCNVGAALSIDFDLDGLIDILIGCQFDDIGAHGESGYHLLFRQLPDGGFEYVEPEEWNRDNPILLEAWGSTLGLGAAELNGDGLWDILVSEDEATRPQYLEPDPGGIYMSCTPLDRCRYFPVRAGFQNLAWGGYMGSAVVRVEGMGDVVYFTDLGRNRAVATGVLESPDLANQLGVTLYDGTPTFSWGVFSDDLDRDGRDDLLVAQGGTKSSAVREYPMHFDAALLQKESRQFTMHSDEVGLAPSTSQDSRNEDYTYSTRAMVRTDIDFDGYMDLFNTALEGVPRMQREVPPNDGKPPRCTLMPADRYVPAFGTGHALLSPVDQIWRQYDSQGQLRSGTHPYVLSPWTTGTMRFPSGARVAYDCDGKAGPFKIEEPEWLVFSRNFSQLVIEVGPEAPEGELVVLIEPEGALHDVLELDPQGAVRRYSVVLPAGSESIMLRFGSWWVSRRFPL